MSSDRGKPWTLAFAAGMLGLGCGAGTSSDRPGPPGSPALPVAAAHCEVVDPTLADGDAAELFESGSVPTFDIYLPPDRWRVLQQNARDEELVEATACFEGRGLGRVGFRFKGAEGSLYSCFDESGRNTCKKLPLKLKFDEFDESRRFFGMKRLNFHSSRYDETYLHERLAYDLFRSMDVVGPRAAWANVRVNGEAMGLFGMVEQVDGRFTADRWPERGEENLFKEVWPGRADAETAASHLETNEEEADVSAFMAFGGAMESAEDGALGQTLGRFVDLEQWARYLAVNDAIAAYDGFTTFYSSEDGSWSGNHNFFLYQEGPSHFVLVPWDEEATFVANSGFGQVPHWTTTPADCALLYPIWSGKSLARAPGCDRVFRALAEDLGPYRAAGRRLPDGPFGEGPMREAIAAQAALIREHVAADPNGPGVARWEASVSFLQREIAVLRARFERLLAG